MADGNQRAAEQPDRPRRPEERAELQPATEASPGLEDWRALPPPPREPPTQPMESTTDQQAAGSSPAEAFTAAPRESPEARSRPAQQAAVRTPRASRAAASPDDVRIGLWGSPSSGKTTFLGALRHAVESDRASGRWNIFPANTVSETLMVQLTHHLITNHEFPPPTQLGAETELRWEFIGDLAGSQFDRRLLRRRATLPSSFMLNLVDVSGEAFGPTPEDKNVPREVIDRALDHLASAQGLLYLFDPIMEQERRDSAEYLNRTIIALSRRMRDEGRLVDGYLPHYVSICVTKFDHPKMFECARESLLVNARPDGMPRVLDRDAEKLFDLACDDSFWGSDNGERSSVSARFIRDELRKRFHPERIRYFVTSAVGFRRPPEGGPVIPGGPAFSVDPRNYANVYEADGKLKIYGPVTPINVLEPLVSLHQSIVTGRRRG